MACWSNAVPYNFSGPISHEKIDVSNWSQSSTFKIDYLYLSPWHRMRLINNEPPAAFTRWQGCRYRVKCRPFRALGCHRHILRTFCAWMSGFSAAETCFMLRFPISHHFFLNSLILSVSPFFDTKIVAREWAAQIFVRHPCI